MIAAVHSKVKVKICSFMKTSVQLSSKFAAFVTPGAELSFLVGDLNQAVPLEGAQVNGVADL
jgi:hypothetical protein